MGSSIELTWLNYIVQLAVEINRYDCVLKGYRIHLSLIINIIL